MRTVMISRQMAPPAGLRTKTSALLLSFGVILASSLSSPIPQVVAAVSCDTIQNQDDGYFWHVADLHWDPTYGSPSHPGSGVSCGNRAQPGDPLGVYGDYACDSPWMLIDSSIAAMKQICGNVDFLIWTGDDTPHNANQSMSEVATIISNLTDKLREHFPDRMTPIYSVLGNHDWSPKNQLPPRHNQMYDDVRDMWSPGLMTFDAAANETFSKSGYYALWINANLRIIGINSNLYYKSNLLTEPMPDPGNQMQWLDDILTETANNQSKAILIGHVPPGVFEKHLNFSWYRPEYNRMFLALLSKHHDVIGGAHFGHHHTDTFRVLQDANGNPITSLLIAPAVTPWETTLPGVMGGAGNNPCIRLVRYNRRTGLTKDIHQYYLDLQSANSASTSAADWALEYKFTEYFRVPDVSTASVNAVAERLMSDAETFSLYYEINDARYEVPGDDVSWTNEERAVHYCAATRLDYDDYDACIVHYNSPATISGAMIVSRQQCPQLVMMACSMLSAGLLRRVLA